MEQARVDAPMGAKSGEIYGKMYKLDLGCDISMKSKCQCPPVLPFSRAIHIAM